jgi:hypothetical protein
MRVYRLKGIWFIAFWAAAATTAAQTSISEAGVLARAGVAAAVANSAALGYKAGLTGFFTHFVCGKPYGYWLEGGLHYASLSQTSAQFSNVRFNHDIAWADVGAYLKLRPHRNNRKKEWALLAGPKISPLLVSTTTIQDTPLGNIRSASGGFGLSFGGHVSVLYKMHIKNEFSLVLNPGAEWNSNLSTQQNVPPLANWHVFFGVGLVLWQGL